MGTVELGSTVNGKLKRGTIKAVVRNADGTVKEDLGVIAYTHRNPLKRWWYKLTGIGLK